LPPSISECQNQPLERSANAVKIGVYGPQEEFTMLLTPKQLQVLRFIRDFRATHSLSPTIDEIAAALGVSKITVHEHLGHLQRKGAIQREKAKARAIDLLQDPDARCPSPSTDSTLSILGTIAAGAPLEAIEDGEPWSISDLMTPGKEHYLLRVRGDSMVEDHIQDGDLVLVERRETARNGETVVAILPDHQATLKRFYREDGRIRLQPANATLDPILTDQVTVRGVVVGVIRKIP
jgi:repressor LexA